MSRVQVPSLTPSWRVDDSLGSAIAVTGCNGKLGGRVASRLAAAGVTQRLLVRDPARAPLLAGATAVVAPYDDRDAVRSALSGINTVLMVSASETPDRVEQHRTFVDAAADAGVDHHIRSRRLQFTALRDNLYADLMPAWSE